MAVVILFGSSGPSSIKSLPSNGDDGMGFCGDDT